jgi:hypothetical protein
MTEPTQILLFAVVITLTTLTVIIGWQIFQILSEIRKMMIKFNTMVDGAVTISGSLTKSFQSMSGFTEGLKAVFGIFSLFKKKEKKDDLSGT